MGCCGKQPSLPLNCPRPNCPRRAAPRRAEAQMQRGRPRRSRAPSTRLCAQAVSLSRKNITSCHQRKQSIRGVSGSPQGRGTRATWVKSPEITGDKGGTRVATQEAPASCPRVPLAHLRVLEAPPTTQSVSFRTRGAGDFLMSDQHGRPLTGCPRS